MAAKQIYESPWLWKTSDGDYAYKSLWICQDFALYFDLPPLASVCAVRFRIYGGYRKGALHLWNDPAFTASLRIRSHNAPYLVEPLELSPTVGLVLMSVLPTRTRPYYVECWYKEWQ